MSKIAIYQGQVPASSTTLASADKTQTIHAATVCNTSGSAATLQFWLAMDGAVASNANKMYDSISVDAGSEVSLSLLVNHAVPAGAIMYAEAGTASALTLTISGLV